MRRTGLHRALGGYEPSILAHEIRLITGIHASSDRVVKRQGKASATAEDSDVDSGTL